MGTVAVGAQADVAVLRYDETPVDLVDSAGVTRTARGRLVAETTVKSGRRVVTSA